MVWASKTLTGQNVLKTGKTFLEVAKKINSCICTIMQHSEIVWGTRAGKPSAWAIVFSVFWIIWPWTMANPFEEKLSLRLCNWWIVIESLPMRQASTCDLVRAPGPAQSAQNQHKSDVHYWELKPGQHETATDEIREKHIIESAAI